LSYRKNSNFYYNVNTTIKITLFLIKITLFLEENSYVRHIFFKYTQQLHEKIIQENSNYEKRLFRLQRNKLYIYKIIYIYIHYINDYVYIHTHSPIQLYACTHVRTRPSTHSSPFLRRRRIIYSACTRTHTHI